MFGRGLSMAVVNLGGAHGSGDSRQQNDLGTMATDVFEMASQGRLDPLIERILPFAELVDGLKTLATGKSDRQAGRFARHLAAPPRFGMARAAWCMEFSEHRAARVPICAPFYGCFRKMSPRGPICGTGFREASRPEIPPPTQPPSPRTAWRPPNTCPEARLRRRSRPRHAPIRRSPARTRRLPDAVRVNPLR